MRKEQVLEEMTSGTWRQVRSRFSGQLLKVIYSCCSIANSLLKNTPKRKLKPFSLISARLK